MSLRDNLLRAFDGKPGHVLSGAVLSRRLGVSRTAVWKQIQSLRAMGFPIASHGRLGYQIQWNIRALAGRRLIIP
jgi:BirA family biotin operon repressor/biotin-[acetyl-CoA-carboxylase] ligase